MIRILRARSVMAWAATVACAACVNTDERTQPAAKTDSSLSATREASARAAAAVNFEIERVSLSSENAEIFTCTSARPSCKNGSHPKISYDGQRVIFDCDALQIVPGFVNPKHAPQIFMRDVSSGQTVLISAARDAEGTIIPPNDGHSFGELSPDGEFVAFGSGATNLTPADTDPDVDVILVRVSNFDIECPTAVLNGSSSGPALSADARFVAFVSSATRFPNLVRAGGAPVTEGPTKHDNAFVFDRTNGTFEWLSFSEFGTEPNGRSTNVSIDDIGSRAVFVSEATDLGIADPNGDILDVFVVDRTTGKISCASVRFDGLATGNEVSRKPILSGNGRYVAFESLATDLLAPGVDTNNRSDIFVRDVKVGVTVRISMSDTGVQANQQSGYSAISPDGRFVGFTSFARNLVPDDPPRGFAQFYVRDRDLSGNGVFDELGDTLTLRLSRSANGTPANARTGGNCDLTADGRTAVFMSESDVLVPNDANGTDAKLTCSPTCLFGRDVFRASFQ